MRFVFWQNVVSIHQSAFIKALAMENDVTLVAQEEIDEQRTKEKWEVPSMGDAQVITMPNELTVDSLLNINNAYHVFSGINAYPMVYKAFKEAIKRRLKVSVMVEPYEWAGLKGKLRQLMYRILNFRYGKHIEHVFATGDMGIICYRKAGFPNRKLHQWGYFTEQVKGIIDNNTEESNCYTQSYGVKLLYVGRIDQNKNILPLLKRFNEYGKNVSRFTIVGDGPMMNELETLAILNPKIKLLGRLSNEEACRVMARHDYLILPSLYDGWGAVVNEALSVGTAVLCSEACGASILLDGGVRGETFTQDTMTRIINQRCEHGPVSANQREEILTWANNNISGKIAAKYFCDVLNGLNPTTPWLCNS